MAVTFDAVGPSSAGTSATGTSLTWSHTCTGSNRLLVVGVAVGTTSSDASFVTTATYNGVAMTSASKVHSNNQTNGYIQMFYLVNPATGSNTVAITNNVSCDLAGGSVSFTGADQSTPLGTPVTNFGDGTSGSVSVPTNVGDMVIDATCNGSGFSSGGSTQTNRWLINDNSNSAAGNGASSTAAGVAGSVSMGYTGFSSDWWGLIGINIKQVTAPPAGATVAWLTA
jgi:hypothetical protein